MYTGQGRRKRRGRETTEKSGEDESAYDIISARGPREARKIRNARHLPVAHEVLIAAPRTRSRLRALISVPPAASPRLVPAALSTRLYTSMWERAPRRLCQCSLAEQRRCTRVGLRGALPYTEPGEGSDSGGPAQGRRSFAVPLTSGAGASIECVPQLYAFRVAAHWNLRAVLLPSTPEALSNWSRGERSSKIVIMVSCCVAMQTLRTRVVMYRWIFGVRGS